MAVVKALLNRNSSPRLQQPAPTTEECEKLYQAALRAPDHGRIRPWRYLHIEGDARQQLGDLYAQAELQQDPDASPEKLAKLRNQSMRAPLIIVAIASPVERDNVPRQEQILSAGCGVHALLVAAESLGYAGVWRTGPMATNETVKAGLGLVGDEEVIGFIYLGTRLGDAKPLPKLSTHDFVSRWGC